VDIAELVEIKKQFTSKYGKRFAEDALNNMNEVVNERVFVKLSVQPPSAFLVQTYLEKIADQFSIKWKPTVRLQPDQLARPMAAPIGYSVEVAPGTGLAPAQIHGNEDESMRTSSSSSTYYPPGKPEVIPGYAASNIPVIDIFPPPDTSASAPVASTPSVATATAVPDQQDINAQNTGTDFYIPPAPGQKEDEITYIPPAPGQTGAAGGNHKNYNDGGGNGGGENADTESLAALRARFAQLKK